MVRIFQCLFFWPSPLWRFCGHLFVFTDSPRQIPLGVKSLLVINLILIYAGGTSRLVQWLTSWCPHCSASPVSCAGIQPPLLWFGWCDRRGPLQAIMLCLPFTEPGLSMETKNDHKEIQLPLRLDMMDSFNLNITVNIWMLLTSVQTTLSLHWMKYSRSFVSQASVMSDPILWHKHYIILSND